MSFFKDKERYVVNVIDLSNPDSRTFTVGVNGDVRTYPTNTNVTLTGVQINVLQDAVHEQAEVKSVNGLNEIVGYKAKPRFAINMVGFGQMPTMEVPDLSKTIVAKEEKKSEPEIVVDTDIEKDTLPEVEKLTADERKTQLEAATRPELMSFCKGEGIAVCATDSKNTLMGKILRYEGYSVN